MIDKINLLKSYGLNESQAREIIKILFPENLENYIALNFKPAPSLHITNWVPAMVLQKFINIDKPDLVFTANQLGRELKKIGVLSRNNHFKQIHKPCAGYYLQPIDNLKLYDLLKLKRSYAN